MYTEENDDILLALLEESYGIAQPPLATKHPSSAEIALISLGDACNSCGAAMKDGGILCNVCGAKRVVVDDDVEMGDDEHEQEEEKTCGYCAKGGHVSYARFCGYCGRDFPKPLVALSQLATQEEEPPLAPSTPPCSPRVEEQLKLSSMVPLCSPDGGGGCEEPLNLQAMVELGDDLILDDEMLRALEAAESNAIPVVSRKRVLPPWMSTAEARQQEATSLREQKELLKEQAFASDLAPPMVVYNVVDSLSDGWWKGRVIVIDVETTGFSRSDSVVEVGAVELVGGRRTGVIFQSYMRPHSSATFHPIARQVNNLTDAFIADQPSAHPILQNFLAFLQDSPIVAHNAPFDLRMLCLELDRLRLPLFGNRVFCTMQYEKKRGVPRASYTLSASARARKISLPTERLHGALVDAELCARLFVAICDSLLAHVL